MFNIGKFPSVGRIYPVVLLGACLAGAVISGPVYAAGGGGGGGGGDSNATPTCPKGEVWSSKAQKCVKQQGSLLPDSDLTNYAFALAEAGRYEEALGVLDTLKNPNTAVALNYRGYATRKLGRTDEGIGYYMKSVELDPQYAKCANISAKPMSSKVILILPRISWPRSEVFAEPVARNIAIWRKPSRIRPSCKEVGAANQRTGEQS